jgi:2'-5' RNA ligase
MSQKYVIVHFIEVSNVPEEFHYSEWPLHVTLLANFKLSESLEELVHALRVYSSRTKPFEITSNGEALFGPQLNVAVSLIQPSNSIVQMHMDLITLSAAVGAEYDEPKFMREHFRPHVTIQSNARLSDKQKISVSSFTLVDMYPNNDIERRKIVKTFKL